MTGLLSEWMHLRTLYEEEGIAQFVLSQRLGIEKASSTVALDNLHQRRLIRSALATDMNSVARRTSINGISPHV